MNDVNGSAFYKKEFLASDILDTIIMSRFVERKQIFAFGQNVDSIFPSLRKNYLRFSSSLDVNNSSLGFARKANLEERENHFG